MIENQNTKGQTSKVHNIMTRFIDDWKNALVFKGRASRSEFWYFMLINVIIAMLLDAVDLLGTIYSIVAGVVPMTSLTVRRLHDVNKSGWWCFPVWLAYVYIVCVGLWVYIAANAQTPMGVMVGFALLLQAWWLILPAFVFSIILLVFCLRKGDKDENDYGKVDA